MVLREPLGITGNVSKVVCRKYAGCVLIVLKAPLEMLKLAVADSGIRDLVDIVLC